MLDPSRLRAFTPLDSLSQDGLARVVEQTSTRLLKPGDTLFRSGDNDKSIYFLLEGSIELRSDSRATAIVIQADSDDARMPISRLKPRRYTATAGLAAEVAVIDEDLLDTVLTADQTASYEVSLIEGEDPEWMFRLFSSPAFAKVPAANLAALLSHMDPVELDAGETVIRQGERGDYYYMIRRGRAEVLRAFDGAEAIQVAELGVGDTFGEEALLSGDPRNATVIMTEPGQLMRLSQADFGTLLMPPLVHRLELTAAASLIGRGGRFIDVRSPTEFAEFSLPGSLNMPLADLRRQSEELDKRLPYVTVCQTERRASAAAFLLNQRGFDVMVLAGGLNAIRQLD